MQEHAFSALGRNAEMSRVQNQEKPSSRLTLGNQNESRKGDFLRRDSTQEVQSLNSPGILVRITPKWDDMNELTKYTAAKHQTLFAMDGAGQAIVGAPTNPDEIKRVCASITSYMKPRFVVQLLDHNGQPLGLSLQTRTTIVNATTGESDEGTCDHCKQVAPSKRPIVYQWRSGRNKLFSEILGQTDEQGRQLLDIKIGCLTGTGLSRQQKGHKHDFMIRTEVIQRPGVVGYSVAIQMGSKYIDCSQKHTKKKVEREVEISRANKTAQRQTTQDAGEGASLPMQLSPTSTSLFPHFGENQIQKHGFMLPPLANDPELSERSTMVGEKYQTSPFLRREQSHPWMTVDQGSRREGQNPLAERIGPAILPPINALTHFERGPVPLQHRQTLPPVRRGQEEPVIPPLEVILSSISQDHSNSHQDSHHRSPMLELAENFMEAASTMEQSITEQGSSGHPLSQGRQIKKQRLLQDALSSDHSFPSYSSLLEGRPLSPMNEVTPSLPSFEIRSPPSIESVLGCPSTNALTMKQRAEIWQFLCGNRTNPGTDPLRYIVLNQEPPSFQVWQRSSVIPVEQTVMELNYETGRWSTYKNQGKYQLV